MTLEEYWSIIDACRPTLPLSDPSYRVRFADSIENRLRSLPTEELRAFCGIWNSLMSQANSADLWNVAIIIRGGCSGSGFNGFRTWLISEGRAAFENAILDPESVIDRLEDGLNDPDFDDAVALCASVLRQRTGHGSSREGINVEEPDGVEEDPQELARRYPRVWARYGDNPL